MMRKAILMRKSALILAAILALGGLSVATDASARGGHGGGGHGGGGHGGGGGGYHGGGSYGGGGGGVRSGLAVRSGGSAALPGAAVRGGTFTARRGVKFHRPFVRHRFIHRFRVYPYYTYGCYRWRRVLTPFGWRLRRVNVCDPYYRQYYY